MRYLLSLLFLISSLTAKTLIVDATPSCFFGICYSCEAGFLPDNPYATISDALSQSTDGDTIDVCKGTYTESVTINKNSIVLQGVADIATDVKIESSGTAITLKGDDETIKRLKVVANSMGIYADSGAKGSHHLESITIESKDKGIYLQQGDAHRFENISIDSGNMGIYIGSGAGGAHIFKNIHIDAANHAIYLGKGGALFQGLSLKPKKGMGLYLGNTDENVLLKDLNITASDKAIYINGSKKLSASKIYATSTGNLGIYIVGSHSNDLSFNDIVVKSKNHALYCSKGGASFFGLSLASSGGMALYLGNVGSDLVINDVNATASDKVFYISRAKNVEVAHVVGESTKNIGLYLSGIGGTIDMSDINISAKNHAIYCDRGGRSFDRLFLKSESGMGLYLGNSGKDISLETVAIDAKNKGVYISGAKKVTAHTVDVQSQDDMGIYLAGGSDVAHDFEDINISAKGHGLYLGKGGGTFRNISIKSTAGRGLDIENSKKDLYFENIDISSKLIALYLSSNVSGKQEFNNCRILSFGDNGIYIGRGAPQIKDVNITSAKTALTITPQGDIVIENIEINATGNSAKGILFNWGSDSDISISKTKIESANDGIYVSKSKHFTLKNSCIKHGDRGIYLSWGVKSPVVKASRIEGVGSWDVLVGCNPSNPAQITGNCFYGDKLAYSNNKKHKFDGNYWDNVVDVNGDGVIDWRDSNRLSSQVVDNNPLSECPLSVCGGAGIAEKLMLDYRMDECSWSGVAEEVKDSSGNNHNGKAQVADTASDGVVCRGGDFAHGSLDDGNDEDDPLVVVDPAAMDGLEDFTVTAWIKTTQSGDYKKFTILSAANGKTSNEVWMYFSNSNRFYPWVKGKHGKQIKIDKVLNDGTWHHVAWRRSGEENCLVVDGDIASGGCMEIKNTPGPLNVEGLVLAQDQDSVLGGYQEKQAFDGQMDEVKIFSTALSDAKIQQIYENEKEEKNWDGSERNCSVCEECGEYEGELGSIQMVGDTFEMLNTYRVSSMTKVAYKDNYIFSETPAIFVLPSTDGGNPASMRIKDVTTRNFKIATVEPQGEDGAHIAMKVAYFAVNLGETSSSANSVVYKMGDHYIEVGYVKTTKQQKGYDESTNAWELITPKVHFCNPVVVAQIQTMNNEPNYNPRSRSKPFLAVAIDANRSDGKIGLALERGETNEGSVDEPETIAYMIAEANFQDAFIDDANNTIPFETIKTGFYFDGWQDRVKEVDFANTYSSRPLVAASPNSRQSLDGGWFRYKKSVFTEDKIGIVVDEDRYNHGRYGGWSGQDEERSKYRNHEDATHTPEMGGIFVFGSSFAKTGKVKLGTINAVDWSQREHFSDGNITTKLVGEVLDLALLAREEDNVTKRDANLSRIELVRCADTLCLDCTATSETSVIFDSSIDGGMIAIPASTGYARLKDYKSYELSEAIRIAKIRITEYRNHEPLPPVCSYDTFAIRPEKFLFKDAGEEDILIAEHLYSSRLEAVALDGSSIVEEYSSTLPLSARKYMRNGEENSSMAGSVSPASVDFHSGVAEFNLTFTDVGKVSIEANDTQWAIIDEDDTPAANRTIFGMRRMQFIPDHFLVSFPKAPSLEDNDTEHNLTYLSNDLNMSGWIRQIEIKIRAEGEANGTMRNYSQPKSLLYANPVDLTPAIHLPGYLHINELAPVLKNAPPSMSGADLAFAEGEVTLPYADVAFNYERNASNPLSPFMIQGDDANMTVALKDVVFSQLEGEGFSSFVGSTRFYFGRVETHDIKTTEQNSSERVDIEVFAENKDASEVSGMKQRSLHWFYNTLHTATEAGGIHRVVAKEGSRMDSATDTDMQLSWQRVDPGRLYVDINNTAMKAKHLTMHIDIDPWLWYVPPGFGQSYSYDEDSDCTMHPCFEYIFEIPAIGGVQSGEFNGSDFGVHTIEQNSSYERKHGVKLFR